MKKKKLFEMMKSSHMGMDEDGTIHFEAFKDFMMCFLTEEQTHDNSNETH